MLEEYLIGNCSPTLASIKTANLFSMPYESDQELFEQIDFWNEQMREKGITVILVRKRAKKALIYVCRIARLQENLRKPGVAGFLSKYGYKSTDVLYALDRLKARLGAEDGFPHEIGIFLDYPLGDVIGFIQNEGKNFKCSGCWKVYCDQCAAEKLFARYKKCREVYLRLWQQGRRSVLQLTVAA